LWPRCLPTLASAISSERLWILHVKLNLIGSHKPSRWVEIDIDILARFYEAYVMTAGLPVRFRRLAWERVPSVHNCYMFVSMMLNLSMIGNMPVRSLAHLILIASYHFTNPASNTPAWHETGSADKGIATDRQRGFCGLIMC
jgi:hypothetical protein